MRNETPVLALIALLATAVSGCGLVSSQERAINHYANSQLLIDQGNVDGALAELARAVRADPTLSIAHAAAGDLYRRQESYQLARRSYENACDANPYAFRPHYNLAWTHQKLSTLAKAAEDFQNCLRRATQVYLRAVMLRPNDFETNLNLSACYFQIGKYDLAEKYCQAAVRIKPDSPHAHSNMGIIYDSQNRLYDAIREYKASLELDTHQSEILANLGSTYVRQGRLTAAINAFELAVAEDDENSASYEQLGACRLRTREFDKALAAYQRAAQLDPSSATAFRGIGVTHVSRYILDQSRVELRDKGLAAWNRSLELKPGQEDLVRLVQKYSPRYSSPEL